MSDGSTSIAMPEEPAPLTGIAAKGEEIALTMLSEEIGGGWRFGDILTLGMQVGQKWPPGDAARLAAAALERVLHNAFVKAKIPPYDQNVDNSKAAFVTDPEPEETGS